MTEARTVADRPQSAPSLPGIPVLGPVTEVRRDYLGTMLRASREVGDVARIDLGPPGWRSTFYSVSSPAAVHHVLADPELYTKDTPAYREVRRALGNGLLTSEGEAWRRQRRFVAPVFTPRRITTSYADIVAAEADRLVQRWTQLAQAGQSIDVHAEMVDITSRIIGRVLFGADMTKAIPRLRNVAFVNEMLLRRGIVPHAIPPWIPTPGNRRLARGLAEIHGVVSEIVTNRRLEKDNSGTDLLGLLLGARDDECAGDRLSDAEVADQVLIFLLAGHETTATTLACGLFELARSPSWQEAVLLEVESVAGESVRAADLPALPWTGRIVREAMRLYPSAHGIGRRAARDDELLGYRIPAGTSVVISPWTIHRSPRVWPEPHTFDPRRFDVPEGTFPGGHRYAWVPFGAGPHTCIGMQLALLEASIVLASIVRSFKLTTELEAIPLTAAVSLRPAREIPVHLCPR